MLAATTAHSASPSSPTIAQSPSKPATTARKAHPNERIYTYKPRPDQESTELGQDRSNRVIVASSDKPFFGFSPVENGMMGVGLWAVPKLERNDPNRGQPLRDKRGKMGKAAAVGFQLSF